MAQPEIQIGYNTKRGGLGTVIAITIAQKILTAQAKTSMKNLNLFVL